MKTLHLRNIVLLLVLASSFVFTGCDIDEICERGKGTRVTEEIFLPEMTGLNLAIAADVFLTQDSVQKVTVVAQENIIDLLKLDVDNDGVWKIAFEGCVRKISDVEIYVSVKDLESLKITGSGDIIAQNRFNVDDLDLSITGSGSIDLDFDGNEVTSSITGSGSIDSDLTATMIESKISGSGNVTMAGTVDELDHRVTGSGDFNGFDLIAQNVYIKISASGDADVHAVQTLEVDITGSGNVTYDGTPQVTANITGSGSVNPR